ncbi:ELL-associated factor [Arctopsyche grandis]|uniref:ELL-associated factor n=1 Tax=Arctopsyche grandis TaxID=121162 RepID=UPI00406D6F60
MADKLRLGGELRELKLGSSFSNNKATSFHTLKCDFKPASVDANKMASVEVGTNNQVTVTVPHLDGSGVPQTVFKGNQRPYQKECVLIIDRNTGVITLEKLSSNIQVKKTRQEPPHKPTHLPTSVPRPHTPVDPINNCTQRSTSRTRVTSGGRKGTSNTPTSLRASPPRHRTSPPQVAPWTANAGQSTLASLPMIGLDDLSAPAVETPPPAAALIIPPTNGHNNLDTRNTPTFTQEPEVGVLSSSSDSSSSGSDSDHSDSDGSDSEPNRNQLTVPNNSKPAVNGVANGRNLGNIDVHMPSMPMQLLNDDLCLSESGSDDD